MRLIATPRRPDVGAGGPDHDRPAQRARELARLSLLERRAGRQLTTAAHALSSALRSCARVSTTRQHPMPSGSPTHLTTSIRRWPAQGGRSSSVASACSTAHGAPPVVRVGDCRAHIVLRIEDARVAFRVPEGVDGGDMSVRLSTAPGETRDSRSRGRWPPASTRSTVLYSTRAVSLYVTVSGARGQQAPVSVFRVDAGRRSAAVRVGHRQRDLDGVRPGRAAVRHEPIRRRRVSACRGQGEATPFVTEVGVACGLAFGRDGTMFVGDRSGTLFRVAPGGQPAVVATLPASVAAYHLAVGPDGWVHVSVPSCHHATASTASAPRVASKCCTRGSDARRGSRSTRRHRSTSSKRWPG